ncbi:hypothetical protein ACHQM5_029018 [Ranunculus cassubicifolius]
MGLGVSKTALINSAHVLELLQQERSLRIAVEDQIADLGEQAISETSASSVEQISTRVTRSRALRGANIVESDKQRTSGNKKRKGCAEHEQTEETGVLAKKKKDKRQRVECEKEPDTDPELGGNSDTDNEYEGPENTEKKVVHFNDKGQPIGEESKPFNSYLNTIMREHCPIRYQKWKDVPGEIKNTVWNLVTDKFLVAAGYKHKVLQKVQDYWRRHKNVLRIRHYDCYDTDEKRKQNCPTFVSPEDWEKFVDNESLPVARARREAGRSARKALKTPHHSGTRGAARTEEKLKRGNPLATVTRTDLYLAMHDGSCTENDKVEKVKAIVRENPESVNFELDLDPVAQVYGSKKKYVVGMGQGVTRKSLIDAAPVIERLQRERMLRLSAQEKLANLKQQRCGESPVASPGESPVASPAPPPPPLSVVVQTPPEEEVSGGENPPEEGASGVSELEKLRRHLVLQDERIEALQEEKEQITDLKKQIISQGLMIADMKELIMRLCS